MIIFFGLLTAIAIGYISGSVLSTRILSQGKEYKARIKECQCKKKD